MTMASATVIDFATARARLARRGGAAALREAARWQRRDELSEEGRRIEAEDRTRFYSELETWPRAFHGLRSRLDYELGSCGLARLRNARSRSCGYTDAWFLGQLHAELAFLRSAALRVRRARAQGSGSRLRPRLDELAVRKATIRWRLFEAGWRRLGRGTLEPVARRELEEERGRLLRGIPAHARALAILLRRLEVGVYERGPRRGQPYTEEGRDRREGEVARHAGRLAAMRSRLAEIEREPDPLRAWGLYARAREERPRFAAAPPRRASDSRVSER